MPGFARARPSASTISAATIARISQPDPLRQRVQTARVESAFIAKIYRNLSSKEHTHARQTERCRPRLLALCPSSPLPSCQALKSESKPAACASRYGRPWKPLRGWVPPASRSMPVRIATRRCLAHRSSRVSQAARRHGPARVGRRISHPPRIRRARRPGTPRARHARRHAIRRRFADRCRHRSRRPRPTDTDPAA